MSSQQAIVFTRLIINHYDSLPDQKTLVVFKMLRREQFKAFCQILVIFTFLDVLVSLKTSQQKRRTYNGWVVKKVNSLYAQIIPWGFCQRCAFRCHRFENFPHSFKPLALKHLKNVVWFLSWNSTIPAKCYTIETDHCYFKWVPVTSTSFKCIQFERDIFNTSSSPIEYYRVIR